MLRKTRLFTPGPTPLLPAAQLAMAAADLHHRTPEFRAMFTRVREGLKEFIGTNEDVIVLASSGTGAMEASVANLVNAGDAVAVITAGKFGERWVGICRAFGCNVRAIAAEYGKTISCEALRDAITPELRAVFMQATESSTGVRHDVAAVAEMIAGSDTLLVVDAITGLGTTALEVDGKIDLLIGGSQKALMCPPGLSFCSVSERAWARMAECRQPRYYFDLRRERKVQAKGESAFTPAVALVAAMDAALAYVGKMGEGSVARGREALVENAERLAEITRAAVVAGGLELFAPESPAAAMTAVRAPAGVSATEIVKRLKAEFGGIVSDGQGEMKGSMFRIAHLGYFDYLDTLGLLGALEQVLVALAPGKFELGKMVGAAQRSLVSGRDSAPGVADEA
jgi:aspartate aminotransferase-like enzyme